MTPNHSPATGDHLRLLWRRKWLLLLPVVIGTAVAYGLSSQQPTVYETHADLLFEDQAPGGGGGGAADVRTEARIVTSPHVTAAAGELLGGTVTGTQLQSAVTAEPVENLPILRVSARAPSAGGAESFVSSTVDAYLAHRADRIEQQQQAALSEATQHLEELAAELDQVTGELAAAERRGVPEGSTIALRARRDQLVSRLALQQGRLDELQRETSRAADDVSVLVPATVPDAPRSPRPLQAGAIGALVGLLLGFALVLGRQQLEHPVRGLDGLESVLVAPVLTVVPKVRGRRRRAGVVMRTAPGSPAAEAYRILRTNLTAAGVGAEHRILLVTSAVEGEGKSTTAANLALAFTETGQQVVLIDADLRRPKLDQLLGVSHPRGLTDVLTAACTRDESIVQVESDGGRLILLPAGSGGHEPAQLLSTPELAAILSILRDKAVVIIDSPPALPVADATMLATHADAVLLTVDTTRSDRSALERLRGRLTGVGTPVIGFTVHAAGSEYDGYQGYHGYHGYAVAARGEPKRSASRSQRRSRTRGTRGS